MKRQLSFAILLLVAVYWATAQDKQNKRTFVCSAASQGMCNPSNTCGSASAPCQIDIKRTDDGSSATPGIPGAKGNAPFCVRVGTAITWHTTSKNTGFTVDFGQSAPFDKAGPIFGGSDRTVTVVAKTPGCYKYSTGACNTEAVYGMCAEGSSEIVISAK